MDFSNCGCYCQKRTGLPVSCRILLDPGSESSFISAVCLNKLQIPYEDTKILVSGIGGSHSEVCRKKTNFNLFSRYNSNETINVNALVLNTITSNLPGKDIIFSHYNLLGGKKYG